MWQWTLGAHLCYFRCFLPALVGFNWTPCWHRFIVIGLYKCCMWTASHILLWNRYTNIYIQFNAILEQVHVFFNLFAIPLPIWKSAITVEITLQYVIPHRTGILTLRPIRGAQHCPVWLRYWPHWFPSAHPKIHNFSTHRSVRLVSLYLCNVPPDYY